MCLGRDLLHECYTNTIKNTGFSSMKKYINSEIPIGQNMPTLLNHSSLSNHFYLAHL